VLQDDAQGLLRAVLDAIGHRLDVPLLHHHQPVLEPHALQPALGFGLLGHGDVQVDRIRQVDIALARGERQHRLARILARFDHGQGTPFEGQPGEVLEAHGDDRVLWLLPAVVQPFLLQLRRALQDGRHG